MILPTLKCRSFEALSFALRLIPCSCVPQTTPSGPRPHDVDDVKGDSNKHCTEALVRNDTTKSDFLHELGQHTTNLRHNSTGKPSLTTSVRHAKDCQEFTSQKHLSTN
eukprot:875233-Amphidinium_carterae.1